MKNLPIISIGVRIKKNTIDATDVIIRETISKIKIIVKTMI